MKEEEYLDKLNNQESRKVSFDEACEKYRKLFDEDESWEERKRRINLFRCGIF